MNTIDVKASTCYQVLVQEGLLTEAGNYIAKVCRTGKAAIISDSNVSALYGKIIESSLSSEGFEVYHYTFPAGEESKSSQTYIEILHFLARHTFTRSDVLIALGGGVVGDITGFAAATYLRGVPYVQIPTSLLAMVDSSVGGKTAIDLPYGKNLVGAFHQPKLVLCDLNCLNTLPEAVFYDGCAEVIKYCVLYDKELFDHLMCHGPNFHRAKVISRCIELKRNVVSEDEFDCGARQKLNLGHTVGHSIEAQSNYSVSHGQAVAMGMAIIAKASASRNICTYDIYEDICKILKLFHLPYQTQYSAEALCGSALSDKKRSGDRINFIIPKRIGECIISSTAVEEVQSFIKAGL